MSICEIIVMASGCTDGTVELAQAIVHAQNPLTARVYVNRVWMHLFNKPLVGTPSDFGLEGDPALLRLGAMVHQLDVGGDPVPEAAGFEAVLAGARERLDDDDALLNEMTAVLDSLYAHFERQATRGRA